MIIAKNCVAVNKIVFGILLATSISSPSFADSETQALRAQIKALEARLDQLEKKQHAVAKVEPEKNLVVPNKGNIEQRLNIVERKQELVQDKLKAKAEKTPVMEYEGAKGLLISSPDKQYNVRMRAYGQVHYRDYFDNSSTSYNNQFLLRTARPVLDAKLTDYFTARLMMDFGSNQTRLLDAYLDFKPAPESSLFNLRAGKFKAPIGLERWQSEQELLYVERGQTTNLVPNRDIGVMAFGQLIPDQLEYHIAYMDGAADLSDNNADSDNHKDISGRIFAHPFHKSDISFLQGLGVGVAGTYGTHTGNVTNPGLTSGYVTIGQARYFSYNGNSFADGTQWRVNPQAYYFNGPFGLMGEYVLDSQEISNGATQRDIRNDAWSAIATYVLTGEDASYDGVKPANHFDPRKGHWGAFEMTGRVGQLNVDKAAFALFSNIATSARRAREGAIGLNWYMNNSIKLNIDYAVTEFDGGTVAGADREKEKALLSQAQFRF